MTPGSVWWNGRPRVKKIRFLLLLILCVYYDTNLFRIFTNRVTDRYPWWLNKHRRYNNDNNGSSNSSHSDSLSSFVIPFYFSDKEEPLTYFTYRKRHLRLPNSIKISPFFFSNKVRLLIRPRTSLVVLKVVLDLLVRFLHTWSFSLFSVDPQDEEWYDKGSIWPKRVL